LIALLPRNALDTNDFDQRRKEHEEMGYPGRRKYANSVDSPSA